MRRDGSGRQVPIEDVAVVEAARDVLDDLIGVATEHIRSAEATADDEAAATWRRRRARWERRRRDVRATDHGDELRAILDEASAELRALIDR